MASSSYKKRAVLAVANRRRNRLYTRKVTTLTGFVTTVMRLWPVAAFVLGYFLIEAELTRNDTTQTELQLSYPPKFGH